MGLPPHRIVILSFDHHIPKQDFTAREGWQAHIQHRPALAALAALADRPHRSRPALPQPCSTPFTGAATASPHHATTHVGVPRPRLACLLRGHERVLIVTSPCDSVCGAFCRGGLRRPVARHGLERWALEAPAHTRGPDECPARGRRHQHHRCQPRRSTGSRGCGSASSPRRGRHASRIDKTDATRGS